MTRIFIAGATGVIGRALVPLLVEAGHQVSAMTRSSASGEHLKSRGVRPVVADVFDRDTVINAVRAAQPEVVYHQLTDLGKRDFAANARIRVEGTRNLVDAALAAGVRRVIVQSIAFMYAPGDHPAAEDEPLDVDAPPTRNSSAAAVQSMEQAVAETPEGVILRYGIFYGAGTWYARDGWVADQIRSGKQVANDSITSFIHVDDAAAAAFEALNWSPGVVNIVDNEPAPGTAWVPVFAKLIGAPPPPIQTGSARGERGASNAKARQQLHWQPRYPSWREGFKVVLE